MARLYRFVVGPHEAHLRLDRYLVRHLPRTRSRAVVQRAIRAGTVTIEGRAVKAHRSLKTGETILVQLDRLPQRSPDAMAIPEPIPLEVVYEDAQLMVVNKPPNLVTHPAKGHWSGTLVNAIAWHLQQGEGSRVKGEGVSLHPPPTTLHRPLARAGIVHRLDKDTSGALVVAKTEAALHALAKQLKARTMSRRYLALVEGQVEFDEGTINASLGRHLKDRTLVAIRYLGGREAVTHYRVLKRFGTREAPSLPFAYTLLELRLETGRTHQIRVHLSSLRHPVLGDVVYGRHPRSYWNALGIPRQLLHAYAIRFVHPMTQQPLEVTVDVPADMRRWLDGFELDLLGEI